MVTVRRLLLSMLCGVFAAVTAHAQVQTGSIVGVASDPSNAVLPGGTVSLSGERLIGGRAALPHPAASSAPPPTSSGRPTSSPSAWGARTPTSSASSTIIPATWWDWTCFAVRQRSMCWRSTARRWRSTVCLKRCFPIKVASTPAGVGPPVSRQSCARIESTTSRAAHIIL